jgi:hypothetical protein
MTLPQIIDLTNGHDFQTRDVYHRHQYQMVPTSNVLQRLSHHIGTSGPILSAVEAVTLDASSNASWDLMLSRNTAALNANTITTANLAIWSGNAIMSVSPTLAAIRSTNFVVSGNASMGNVNAGQIVNAGTSYRIANTNVLTSTSLGAGITTSSLTTVGTLSTINISGNARVGNVTSNSITGSSLTMLSGGVAKLDNAIMRGFVRTVGATLGDTVEICQINASRGAYVVDLSVVQSELSNSINKQYKFSHVSSSTGVDVWRRLVPFVSSGPSSGNDWAVDINSVSTVAKLRLVRTGAAASVLTSNVTCSMTVYQSSFNQVTITDISGVSNDTTVWPAYRNALISQLNNNVGIGTDSPAHPLDVVGNVSCGNLSTNTVTATVITTGNARISNTTYRTFTKTLGAAVNDFSIICDLTNAAAFGFELAVVQSTSGNAIAKYYSGTSQFNSTGGAWRRLIPFSSTGPSSTRDWAVDFQNLNSTGSFRLVRTDTSGFGNTTSLACALKIYNHVGTVVVNESSVTDINATNTGYYENTLIGQIDNRVGIGTDAPTVFLDVAGNTNVSGTLNVTGNARFGNVSTNAVIATVITGNTASVSGNLATGNLTVDVGGRSKLDNFIFQSFQKTLGVTGQGQFGGDMQEICTIAQSVNKVGFTAELYVVQAESTNSLSKTYIFTVGPSTDQWQLLLPLTNASSTTGEFAVEIYVNSSGTTTLRLVRLAGSGTDTHFFCNLKVSQSRNQVVTITDSTAAGAGVSVSTVIYKSTLITQTRGSVGIGTDNPSYFMDITGDTNISTGNVFRIGGTQVLSGSALGTGVLASSLTSVGTLSTLNVSGNVTSGNLSTNVITATAITGTLQTSSQPNITSVGTLSTLNVSGNVAFGNVSTNSISATAITGSGPLRVNSSNNILDGIAQVTVSRTISGSTLGSGINIGSIGAIGQIYGTSIVEVKITSTTANNTTSKAYTIPFDATISYVGSIWKRALPTVSTSGSPNDVGLEVAVDNNQLYLALARTKVDSGTITTSTPYQVAIVIHFNKASNFTLANGWNPSLTGYTSTMPAVADYGNIFSATCITQRDNGGVSIMTESAQYNLDVNGSGRFTTNLYSGTLSVTANVAAGNLSTNAISATAITGTSGTLNVSGNIVCTQPFQGRGVYIPASMGSDTCGINFANKWRIWYNPETEDLEIHKNNNPTDTANIVFWSSYDSTAILASSD